MNNNDTQGVDLSTKAASVREVLKLAFPIILSMVSMSVLGLVDTYFMGLIGPGAQAAVGTGSPTIFGILSLFLGLIAGLTTFVSQFFGAGEHRSCGLYLGHTLMIAAVIGMACPFFLIPGTWHVLNFMDVNPEILQDTYDYIKIRLIATPWVFVGYSLISFLRGLGDMKTPAIVSAITVIANIPLTYVFAFGLGPIPAMGVAGAAVGTIISQCIETSLYASVVFGRKNNKLFATRRLYKPQFDVIKLFFKVGLPIGLSWALEQLGWMMSGFYVATLSKESAAANSIVMVLMNLVFMPGLAISIAATTLVGQYKGAGNLASAEKSAIYCTFLAMGCLVSIGLILLAARYPISGAFSNDVTVIETAAGLFWIGALYQVFDAVGTTIAGALRGAGDTRYPMFVSTFCMLAVMLPLVFFLGGRMDVYGVWWAFAIAIMLQGILYFLRFKIGTWKTIALK